MKSHPREVLHQNLLFLAIPEVTSARRSNKAAADAFRQEGKLALAAFMEDSAPRIERRAARNKVLSMDDKSDYELGVARQAAIDVIPYLYEVMIDAAASSEGAQESVGNGGQTPWFESKDSEGDRCWIKIHRHGGSEDQIRQRRGATRYNYEVLKCPQIAGDPHERQVDTNTWPADVSDDLIGDITSQVSYDNGKVTRIINSPYFNPNFTKPDEIFACVENLVIPQAPDQQTSA